MRAVRRGALLGTTVMGCVLAVVVVVDCASTTQIIIDVRADPSLCQDPSHPLSVGVGVTKAADVNNMSANLETFQSGCHVPDQGVVGSITIKPSGDKSETVGIRVVAAVGGDANACATDQSNCIIATRLIAFQSGETVRETISLSGMCKGEVCGENQDCVAGQCVDRTAILNDGGITPDTGHPTQPEAAPPGDTGVADVYVDNDACAHCSGGTAATCNQGVCTITCNAVTCQNVPLCAPGLTCKILCDGPNACAGTHCGGPNVTACSFDCSGELGGNHCGGITCDAGSCNAYCGDAGLEPCNGVTFTGTTDTLTCLPSDDTSPGCDKVTCGSKDAKTTCTRTCGAAAGDTTGCGDAAACQGTCTDFQLYDAGPPPAADAATPTQ